MATAATLMSRMGVDVGPFQRGMRSAEQTAASSGKNISNSFATVQRAIETVVAAVAVKKLFDFGKDVALTASRTEELGLVLEVTRKNALQLAQASGDLTRAAQLSASAIQATTAAVKEKGITTQVASTLVAQFARYELDMTKATDLARLAQDAAVFSMQNSSEALEGLLHGILTYNPRVLRTYGITMLTEEAFGKWAQTLGKTAEDLTQAERANAVLYGVLEQAPAIAGAYEAAMGSAGKQMRSLTRYSEEMKNALGKQLQPAFLDIVRQLEEFYKWVTQNADALGKLAGAAGTGAAEALRTTLQAVTGLVGQLNKLDPEVVKNAVRFGVLAIEGVALAAVLTKVAGAAKLLWAASTGPVGIAAAALVGLYFAYQEVGKQAKETLAAQTEAWQVGADQPWEDRAAALSTYGASLADISIKSSEATVRLQGLGSTSQEFTDSLSEGMLRGRDVVREVMSDMVATVTQFDPFAALAKSMAGAEYVKAVRDCAEQAYEAQREFANDMMRAQIDYQAQSIVAAREHERERQILIVNANAQIAALMKAGKQEEAGQVQQELDRNLQNLETSYTHEQRMLKWHLKVKDAELRLARAQEMQKLKEDLLAKALLDSGAKGDDLRRLATFLGLQQNAKVQAAIFEANLAAYKAEIDKIPMLSEQEKTEMYIMGAKARLEALMAEVTGLNSVAEAWENYYNAMAGQPVEPIPLPPIPSVTVGAGAAPTERTPEEVLAESIANVSEAFERAMDTLDRLLGWVPRDVSSKVRRLIETITGIQEELWEAAQARGPDWLKWQRELGEMGEHMAKGLEALSAGLDLAERLSKYKGGSIRDRAIALVQDIGALQEEVWRLADTRLKAGHQWMALEGSAAREAAYIKATVEGLAPALDLILRLERYGGVPLSRMRAFVRDVGRLVDALGADLPGVTEDLLRRGTEFNQFGAATLGVLGSVADFLEKMRGYENVNWGRTVVFLSNLTSLFYDLKDTLDLLTAPQAGLTFTEEQLEWAKNAEAVVDAFGAMVDLVNRLREYENVPYTKTIMFAQNATALLCDLKDLLLLVADPQFGIDFTEAEVRWADTARKITDAFGGVANLLEKLEKYTSIPMPRLGYFKTDLIRLIKALGEVLGDEEVRGVLDEQKAKSAGFAKAIFDAFGGIFTLLQGVANWRSKKFFVAHVKMFKDDVKALLVSLVDMLGELMADTDLKAKIEKASEWSQFVRPITETFAGLFELAIRVSGYSVRNVAKQAENVRKDISAIIDEWAKLDATKAETIGRTDWANIATNMATAAQRFNEALNIIVQVGGRTGTESRIRTFIGEIGALVDAWQMADAEIAELPLFGALINPQLAQRGSMEVRVVVTVEGGEPIVVRGEDAGTGWEADLTERVVERVARAVGAGADRRLRLIARGS